jgi:hypothetical protein
MTHTTPHARRIARLWAGPLLWAALGLSACGDTSEETGLVCAANAPEVVAACPAGTSAQVDAQAQDSCEGALDGRFDLLEEGGEANVSGACTAAGSCRVLCAFLEPCACGVERITRDEITCAPCGACGNGTCDAGEDEDDCPQDCARPCEAGQERCDGEQREVCNARSQWESLDCADGSTCRELEDGKTECRQPEVCECAGVSACCDGCHPRALGEACESGRFCTTDTTCQPDGACGGGTPRDCAASVTDARCQAPSCDETRDRCVAIPAHEGDLCDEPSTLSLDHCDDGQCVADGCQCSGVNDCCDGCNPIHAGEACDDGLFCTLTTTCDARGRCEGQARDCGAELGVTQCYRASCDEDADQCAASPDPARVGQGCDDGAFCTVATTCQPDGACGAGAPRDCSDAVTEPQCQAEPTCDEDADRCAVTPARLGEGCDDGLYCVEGSSCQPDGSCGGGEARDCSAAVTEPQCQSEPTCDEGRDRCAAQPRNEGMSCDDGNPLSASDACVEGVCRGVPPHAEVDCDGGACEFVRCQVGWDDADMDCLMGGPCANGCEACRPFADGTVELPDDGIDNDCAGGPEPTNDESRGFYVDPSFTPAGAAPCGDVPRGWRACPFTSLADALVVAEDQPWGEGEVKRELYLAAGRFDLRATVEVYVPVILIGGYTRTPTGPWTQGQGRTELVHRDPERAALYLSMDTYGLTVLDRLAISPSLEVQGPNHGDLALLRVTRLSDADPLALWMSVFSGEVCDELWLDHVQLENAAVLCNLTEINDSTFEGAGMDEQQIWLGVFFLASGYATAVRSEFLDRSPRPEANITIGIRDGGLFAGNRVEGINVSLYGHNESEGSRAIRNHINGFSQISGLHLVENVLTGEVRIEAPSMERNWIESYGVRANGLNISCGVMKNNFVYAPEYTGLVQVQQAWNNTLTLNVNGGSSVINFLDNSNEGNSLLLDSNLIFVLGEGASVMNINYQPQNRDLISIRNNIFVFEQDDIPFLTNNIDVLARTLSQLNRYSILPECGRGGNQWFSTEAALGWGSTIPGTALYGVPAAGSVQIDAGLTAPYECDGVRVPAQELDVRGNPRVCGEAVDIGAFELCP